MKILVCSFVVCKILFSKLLVKYDRFFPLRLTAPLTANADNNFFICKDPASFVVPKLIDH
jgi:hypothetical protein